MMRVAALTMPAIPGSGMQDREDWQVRYPDLKRREGE
jgi:hypothetical protein